VIFNCGIGYASRVNCDEIAGDRPRQPANRNSYDLSCVSRTLNGRLLMSVLF